jgi:hypothetical protein
MKKDIFVNIAISFISIVLVLCAAEIIMRIAWQMGGLPDRPLYQRSPDPYMRYELKPGAKYEQIVVNDQGYRGPSRSPQKPANTFRILMLGDSETLSLLLPEKDSLAGQLETLLNKKSSGPHYEVLNFGVEGYNTFSELEQLKVKGLKYNSDLIILNYCLNDPDPAEYYFSDTFWMRHSALVRWFSWRIKKNEVKKERKKADIKTENDFILYLHQPKYFNPVARALQEMGDIAKAHGNKLAVVIFPCSGKDVPGFKENYPFTSVHKLIKGIPSDKIIFIDLLDEFNRLNLNPPQVSIDYYHDESHKNAAALKISAEYIYGILKSNKAIP